MIWRMTLMELAEAIGGTLSGDGSTVIERCASINNAKKGSLVYVDSPQYLEELKTSSASAAIMASGMESDIPSIVVERPALAFARAMEILHPRKWEKAGIHPTASVEATAKIGSGCSFGPHVAVGKESVIGDATQLFASVSIGSGCTIGSDCILYPGVILYDGCIIGDRVILHAGVVIGADGFRYVDDEKGSKVKLPHIGIVRIGDDVEIQANCCIDRAMLGETHIGSGVKMDNLVHVGHNVVIGENTVIAGQCGFSGSVRIGKNVVMGGHVVFADHVEVADGVILAGRTGVTNSIKKAGIYGGTPAMPIGEWRKAQVAYKRGGETLKRLHKLEKSVLHAHDKTKGENK